jgi:hypothetical protein
VRNFTLASSLLLAAIGISAVSSPAQSQTSTLAVPESALPPAALAEPSAPQPPAAPPAGVEMTDPLARVGVGIHLSTLGPGAEVGVKLTPRINVRGAANYFSYNDSFTSSGITYGGNLKFESGEAYVDYFLWRSVHVSPGVIFANGTLFGGSIGVPGGQTFKLSENDYTSSAANPLTGTGALNFNKVSPSILFGIGSIVPRGDHHFSMKFEVGGAFRGSPAVGLNFTGSVCNVTCQTVGSDAQFQTDLAAQERKYNNDISFLKFYPIISLGFGFKL